MKKRTSSSVGEDFQRPIGQLRQLSCLFPLKLSFSGLCAFENFPEGAIFSSKAELYYIITL